MPNVAIHLRRILIVLLAACGLSHADKTLMWLTDWYQGNLDSVVITSVSIPHYGDTGTAKDGYYYGKTDLSLARTNAYAPFIKVNSKVSNDGKPDSLKVPKELARYWYAQPNFNDGNFKGGMVNVMLKFQSFNHTYQQGPPAHIQLDKGTGTGQTGQLNQGSSSKLGFIDSCIDKYNSDTLWMYASTSDSTISPGYVGNSISCADHNPFFIKVGTVHVYNPWPGKSLYIQQGGQWYPLFADSGRQGWQSTTLWASASADTSFKVRIASGKPGTAGSTLLYLDASGISTSAGGPTFDFSSAPGSEQWIIPPTSSGTKPKAVTKAPIIKTVLMIQRPNWNASGVRVLWKGYDSRFIAGSTSYCSWYSLALYDGIVPDSIVLENPVGDTLYGMNGLEPTPAPLSSYKAWIPLGQSVSQDTTWIVTNGPLATFPKSPNPSTLKLCDTKTLAFSAYDYADGSFMVSGSKYFYAPFAETNSGVVYPSGSSKGQSTDNCPSAGGGATKGLVLTTLNKLGRPQWSGKIDCDIGDTLSGPQNWFDPLTISGTRVNAYKCVPLALKLDQDDGYYKYSSGNFFPLSDDSDIPSPYRPGNNASDFHFAMHAKASFEYVRGLTFKFSGDDDVWIFINKKLALDLGGQHGPMSGAIDLDKLGLVEGKSYQFDMFYCERHQTGSNIGIQTTMNLVPIVEVNFDTTASNTSKKDVLVKTVETTTNTSVCPEDGASTTQTTVAGRSAVYLIYPDGTQEAVDSIKYKDVGLAITDQFSHITIDTLKLQKSGLFTQSGQYQILISMGTENYSIGFSIVTRNIDAVATIYDRNGDGRADSVFVNGDGASPAFKGAFQAVFHWADNTGTADSVVVGADSLHSGLGDSTASATFAPLPLRTSCPPEGCTGLMGRLWGLQSDTVKNRIVELRDGIAPVADSAWLVYDTTGTGMDTLYVRASEALLRYAGSTALPAGDSTWAILGNSAVPRPLAASGILSEALLAIPLDPATDPVVASDSVRLGGYAADLSGNAPGARSRWVPISAKPHLRAWMLDRDGDGMPDSVVLSAKGDLSSVDTLRVHWKTYDGIDTTLIVATPGGVSGGVKLPASTLQNATYCKGCTIDIVGAASLPASVPLADSVAPVPVKATLITAGASSPDTLEVIVSEGFKASGKDFVRLSSDSAGTQTTIPAAAILDASITGSTLRLIVASGTLDVSQDWLRLTAGVQDSTGATVGTLAKWVHLKIRPSGSASLFDADGDGRADSVFFTVRGSISSLNATTATLSWKDVDGRTIHRTWPLGNSTSGSFGLHPSDSTLWFPFGATSCPGSNCTIALGDVEWPLQDSVAPVALSGRYSFGTGTAPDTLRVKLSETATGDYNNAHWMDFGAGTTLAATVKHSDGAVTGDTAVLLVTAANAPTQLVDHIRAVSGIRDAAGNAAQSGSAWAPLSYGVPPLSVTVKDPSGQGSPDQLVIRTTRTVPVAALAVDSISLAWSNGSGTDLDIRSLSLGSALLDSAAQSWNLTLSKPLATGATGCTLAGCGATAYGSSGSTPATLVDSAAAVLLSAKLFYSLPEIARDTVVLQLSEPWTPADPASSDPSSALAYLGSSAQIKDMTPMLDWSLSSDGRTLSLVIDTLHSNLLGTGDSAWLSPRSRDASGNRPASNSRRVPLIVGRHPAQLHISVWPPLLKNEGASAWNPPSEGTPEFEILTRPHNAGYPWTSVGTGSTTPINDTAHVTGIKLTLNRPLTGALYIFDQLGVAVNRFDLKDLAKLWGDSTTGTNDQTRDVWITWNGTDAHRSFVASGVYLLRLVAVVETEPGKTELYNVLKKVGWSRK